jgi:hypothetical protein
MQTVSYAAILFLGSTAYITAVWQILKGTYQPSFFSRGVWVLLGINSFAGVLLGGGSKSSVLLALTLLLGNAAVFIVSYKKGSRAFGTAEKISLTLLIISTAMWLGLDAPYIGLIISLAAHFIGGIPTIVRVARVPSSEQAYHWYFFFVASIVGILSSDGSILRTVLFPAYFAFFDGLIILLANRNRIFRHT